jgi:ARC6-like protein
MTERARTLKIGGVLLAIVVLGLVLGFIFLRNNDSASPNPSPTVTSTDFKTQVEQAYLHYWDVYTEANLKLDTSRLGEVLTGEALKNVQDQIEAQKTKNQPVRIRVEHNYTIIPVDATTATVDDTYTNHSQRLDPRTGEPVDKDPNQRVQRTYTLKKVDGSWKVSFIVGFK